MDKLVILHQYSKIFFYAIEIPETVCQGSLSKVVQQAFNYWMEDNEREKASEADFVRVYYKMSKSFGKSKQCLILPYKKNIMTSHTRYLLRPRIKYSPFLLDTSVTQRDIESVN
jgi:hypothetical protein